MKYTYQRNALFAFLLLCLSPLSGCFDKEEKEAAPPDITVNAVLDESQAERTIAQNTITFNDLKVGDTKLLLSSFFPSSFTEKIVLKDNNDYSFELVYRIGFITNPNTKATYSGSIPKAMFTNTAKANTLKIAVVGTQPMVYMNDVKLANPTVGSGSGSGGTTNGCYVGTWKTAGGCTNDPSKQLTYYFGPLVNGVGTGYSQGPDCTGLCTSTPKFKFSYTVSGNKISYSFTGVDQPVCSVSVPPVAKPSGEFSITYTCGNNNNELVTEAVNVQTGVRTVLTFTRS